MSTLAEKLTSLWNTAKSEPAKVRLKFEIPVPEGAQFQEKKHYMQILINEMFLANDREWFIRYDPVALVAPTYIYGRSEQTVPILIGPSLFNQFNQETEPKGKIIRNAPVSGLVPYQGGPLTLTVFFSKVERANNVEKILDVVENLADLASPLLAAVPFATYLTVAGSVMDGVRTLMDMPETEPLIGYRETINPDIKKDLQETYLVLIDAEEADLDKSDFEVADDRLLYKGAPYRDNDFMLLQIAQGVVRTDENLLPFYPLWVQTRDLAAQSSTAHFWDEAKAHFNTLKRELLNSPDLTQPDYNRFRTTYLEGMKALRVEAVEEANLSAAEKIDPAEEDMQRITDELNELDEL